MIGVSFQPGADQFGQQNGNGRPSGGSGVQEAIRVLSLRLPRVLGAQSAASMPLLTSQGSGGNPRVDSIVNQVLSRVGGMGGGQQPMMQPWQPDMGTAGGPAFEGTQHRAPQQAPWSPPPGFTPRITVDNPGGQRPRWPEQTFQDDYFGGGGQPPGMFGELPPNFQPPTPPPPPTNPAFGDIGRRLGEYQRGYESPFDQSMS